MFIILSQFLGSLHVTAKFITHQYQVYRILEHIFYYINLSPNAMLWSCQYFSFSATFQTCDGDGFLHTCQHCLKVKV